MGDALLRSMLVQESATVAYFRQGVNDGQIPLDVQALGAIYLRLRGDGRSTQVLNGLQSKFAVALRRTASGAGPYSGYRPYVGTGTPDAIWTEGTVLASLAFNRLGVINLSADLAVDGLAGSAVGSSVGPIGADRDVVSQTWGEYHTWPASAAASWMLIRAAPDQLLFAR